MHYSVYIIAPNLSLLFFVELGMYSVSIRGHVHYTVKGKMEPRVPLDIRGKKVL